MEKITYFIGAGASYHSLPLIKTMNERMRTFRSFLKNQKDNGTLTHKFSDKFIDTLDELIEIEKQRTSIDAYARQLALSNDRQSEMKLLHLKAVLSSYLLFEQLNKPKDLKLFSDELDTSFIPPLRKHLSDELYSQIMTPLDKRYITFFGDYLTQKSDVLPNNVKVLSWNYDMQFEFAYSQIKKYNIDETQERLQVYPSTLRSIDNEKSCILKLNGTAGLVNDYRTNKKINLFDLNEHTLMDNLDYLIELLEKNYSRAFNNPIFWFAWESNQEVEQTRQLAKKVIEDTTILVIVGYSFPSFNKQIDKSIFEDISKMKKIYYQAPNSEIDELSDKLDGINPNMKKILKPITNLSTFYIPNEY